MKNQRNVALFFLTLVGLVAACSKPFDRMLSNASYSDTTKSVSKTPKVLYLIVDGARGWSVRDAGTTNIAALTNNAIYSWYSVSDSLANDGNGWADLLTGVTKAKHKVIDNTFNGNNLNQYPTIFRRIRDQKPDTRIAMFAASPIFNANFSANTDQSQLFANDAAVATGIIGELGNDAASLIVGEFNGVNAAGMQYGYDNSFPQYKNAILQFDQYLGQIMTALKARKTYAKENWLVVVTSNHGGPASIPAAQNDGTVFSYTPVSTFTIIYNASYQPKLIDKPFTGNKYIGNFLHLYSTANNDVNSVFAKVKNNNAIYNLGDTSSFTIEFKVKKSIRAGVYSYNWPIILSKKDTSLTVRTGRGWSLAIEINTWRLLLYNANNVSFAINGGNLLDGNWHSCAVVITNKNFNRVVRMYQDGLLVGSETVIPATIGNIDNSAPLRMGYIKTDNTNTFDGYLSDIRIWKVAVPDAVIAQYACNTTIDKSHPYWNYIIGYWPGNDGSGLVIKDLSPANNNFNISVGTTTTLQWNSLSDIICPPSTAFLSTLVPRNVDLPRQILSWFTISPPDNWLLDGRVWLN
ncbi:hypothetical protein BEL04_12345 [Mucilaginibacter sp. PPCGB 2223]|uniref:LamG-like jellyroll fold domain-containing protein n=1 Tax=Mucilaginibacter sp. PPCGB 2223 TaxID=1886027 RepID=UPI0008268324|nr:LamG-like jellyroll fold domain-containing protein [Mucilaginibacter sp. PPCGB 2223]OCX52260.1 hypothetical protein BEL04_12345 [Mucilaginibacter sp. PPCGB 2223]